MKFKFLQEILNEINLDKIPDETEADIAWCEFDKFMNDKHKVNPKEGLLKD